MQTAVALCVTQKIHGHLLSTLSALLSQSGESKGGERVYTLVCESLWCSALCGLDVTFAVRTDCLP